MDSLRDFVYPVISAVIAAIIVFFIMKPASLEKEIQQLRDEIRHTEIRFTKELGEQQTAFLEKLANIEVELEVLKKLSETTESLTISKQTINQSITELEKEIQSIQKEIQSMEKILSAPLVRENSTVPVVDASETIPQFTKELGEQQTAFLEKLANIEVELEVLKKLSETTESLTLSERTINQSITELEKEIQSIEKKIQSMEQALSKSLIRENSTAPDAYVSGTIIHEEIEFLRYKIYKIEEILSNFTIRRGRPEPLLEDKGTQNTKDPAPPLAPSRNDTEESLKDLVKAAESKQNADDNPPISESVEMNDSKTEAIKREIGKTIKLSKHLLQDTLEELGNQVYCSERKVRDDYILELRGTGSFYKEGKFEIFASTESLKLAETLGQIVTNFQRTSGFAENQFSIFTELQGTADSLTMENPKTYFGPEVTCRNKTGSVKLAENMAIDNSRLGCARAAHFGGHLNLRVDQPIQIRYRGMEYVDKQAETGDRRLVDSITTFTNLYLFDESVSFCDQIQ